MKVEDAIKRAKAEVGVTEYPANSNNVKYNIWFYGKMVQGSAYPWCAAFISYIFKDSPNLVKKTASCLDMLEWFEAHNRVVTHPQPGDIVFFKYFTNKRRTNHVGIIISVADNSNFLTICKRNCLLNDKFFIFFHLMLSSYRNFLTSKAFRLKSMVTSGYLPKQQLRSSKKPTA